MSLNGFGGAEASATTGGDGHFTLPGMRVGPHYLVTVDLTGAATTGSGSSTPQGVTNGSGSTTSSWTGSTCRSRWPRPGPRTRRCDRPRGRWPARSGRNGSVVAAAWVVAVGPSGIASADTTDPAATCRIDDLPPGMYHAAIVDPVSGRSAYRDRASGNEAGTLFPSPSGGSRPSTRRSDPGPPPNQAHPAMRPPAGRLVAFSAVGTEKRERQKAGRQARLEAAMAEQRKKEQRRRFITFGVLGVLVVGGLWAWSAFGGDDGDDSAGSTTTTVATDTTAAADGAFAYGTTECAPDSPPDEPVIDYEDSFQDCLDPNASYVAVFDTNQGEIRVDLDTAATPGTVNNFVNLARNGYYDGTEIFRTDTSIGIIQGGSPHTNDASDPGPGYTIPDEGSGYTYAPGQLVMARTADPNSASAQFFFVGTDAAAALDSQGTYVVFGTTDDAGIEVINAILALNEDDPSSGLGGAPSETVTINAVTIEETAAADSTTTTAG